MKHATLRSACWQTFRRDILLLLRKRMDFFQPLVFGFLVTLMFPLGLGPAPDLLATLAPGLVWIIALLSCLLATDGMFQQDYDDGSLTFLLLSPHPAYFLVMTRLWAQWLKSGLAVTLVAPVLGVMLQLPYQAIPVMVASLLAGTVSLVFIGAIGAALTVGPAQQRDPANAHHPAALCAGADLRGCRCAGLGRGDGGASLPCPVAVDDVPCHYLGTPRRAGCATGEPGCRLD
jgi:heme exporter protein CcmB